MPDRFSGRGLREDQRSHLDGTELNVCEVDVPGGPTVPDKEQSSVTSVPPLVKSTGPRKVIVCSAPTGRAWM